MAKDTNRRQRRRPVSRRQASTTRRGGRDILAEIDALERQFQAADDAEIENWSEDLADEEADIAEESTGESVEVGADQTDKANDNWTAGEKEKVARVLLKCASMLLAECGGEEVYEEAEAMDEEMDEEGMEMEASKRRARIRKELRSRRARSRRSSRRRAGKVPEEFKDNQFKKEGEEDKEDKKASRRAFRSRRPRRRRD